jgi:hypothetical protein
MKNCTDVNSTYGCSKIPNTNASNFQFMHTNCRKRKKFLAISVSLLSCNVGDRKPKEAQKNKNCNARRLDFEV